MHVCIIHIYIYINKNKTEFYFVNQIQCIVIDMPISFIEKKSVRKFHFLKLV